jgi:hypothetical protein
VIHRLIAAVILSLALFPSTGFAASHHPKAPVANGDLAQFDVEPAAQRHCHSDKVVWLNSNSGIYHERGMRWYGRTKYGAYVCRREADAASDRDTQNGQ